MPTSKGQVSRPAFHFTPQRNWMNDPNGLVYHRGVWHLYFQYNPENADWGNMSWGHATSPDLQHWTEHPVALRYREGEQIFSGSIVASTVNGTEQLTAYYTSAYGDHRQAQSTATSHDGGFTWQLNPNNPVLDRGTSAFRDPKVIRYTNRNGDFQWILLAVEADDRQVLFYASSDLRSWEYLSTFGPIGDEGLVWECPDLFPLAVDGDPECIRWVLVLSTNPVGHDADADGSSMSYFVGQFDGVSFIAETQELTRVDHGRDFYAGVTFDSAPGGEVILLGWMSNWRYATAFPTAPWRGAMSIPRRLSLRVLDGTPRLMQEPPAFVSEHLAKAVPATVFGADPPFSLSLSGHSLIDLRWDPATSGVLRLRLQGDTDSKVEIIHSSTSQTLHITRSGPVLEALHPDFASRSTVELATGGAARLLLILDGPLLEVFVGNGESTVSNLVVPGRSAVTATLETERHTPVTVTSVDLAQSERITTPAALDHSD
ncbi:levanase/fructan beta-fructosidase/levanbiose-producing levanase [Okibacterium sp. HSC-33S16]|uniref:glycoside hydrolase family 32 protein n=1 Tax=Okibacterium sp. HSC-33S16 TaxID=2910965 RepID=UPI00209FBB36|nr:glycoside hydrolase family 32 protein [Okibacterium sp. HSC-33S16]MCP2031116.1 levanase/fructan beta-fructosidase/levanbiose-producing levanase [Okibacterium sp. HSC-33S16]